VNGLRVPVFRSLNNQRHAPSGQMAMECHFSPSPSTIQAKL